MVDARDLKSLGPMGCTSSSLVPGTNNKGFGGCVMGQALFFMETPRSKRFEYVVELERDLPMQNRLKSV